MLAGGEVPWRDWLTHRFPLARWRHAFRTAARPQDHAAVKVTIAIDEKRGERRLRTA